MSLLLALLLSQTGGYYTPQEAQQLFLKSNDAFHAKDYAAACDGYRKLIEHGAGGPDVLYNLGTAHLAAGELGPAVLELERARRLQAAEDIDANLAVARTKVIDEVVGATAHQPFFQRLALATAERTLSLALLAATWLTLLCTVLAWRLPSRRGTFAAAALVLLLSSGGLGLGVFAHAWVAQELVEAVVQPATVKVLDGPTESAHVSFEVHAGLSVRVVEESGNFVKIRLGNGLEGWTPKEGVARL